MRGEYVLIVPTYGVAILSAVPKRVHQKFSTVENRALWPGRYLVG